MYQTRQIVIAILLLAAGALGLLALQQLAGLDLDTLRTQINQGTVGVPEVIPEDILATVTTTCDAAQLATCQKVCLDDDTACRLQCQSGCVEE